MLVQHTIHICADYWPRYTMASAGDAYIPLPEMMLLVSQQMRSER